MENQDVKQPLKVVLKKNSDKKPDNQPAEPMFAKMKREETMVTFKLRGGEKFTGKVVAWTTFQVVINVEDKEIVLLKHAIDYFSAC